jgi:ribose transport system ATP-binding protein
VQRDVSFLSGTTIECKNIAKCFGAVRALRDASITVKPGEIRALFGGNGSGKSTLAKILGGTVAPDSGSILINDQVAHVRSPICSKKLGIIVTSQELSLAPNLSMATNVLLSCLPTKSKFFLDKKAVEEKAKEQLKILNLGHLMDREISELPNNQKYMVEFAKALVQEPKLLVVDEVTSALFSQDFEIVKKILFKLSDNGVPIIFISHRMNEIYDICQTVTIMRNGSTLGTHSLRDVSHNELLSQMSGKEVVKEEMETMNAASFIGQGDQKIMLSVQDLTLPKFGHKIAFHASAGQFIGISGLQGQGQSEFIRSIFGMIGPVEMEIDGEKVTCNSPLSAIENGIGFVSGDRENEGIFSERSIQENLNAVRKLVLRKGEADYQKVISAYGVVMNNLSQPIKSLSGGNQQKVVIGRWTSMSPKVLLADDPNKGVDVQARRDVHLIFKELVDAGSTVIMVSSDDEELVDISKIIPESNVLIMYEGQIVKTLQGTEISVENIVAASLSKGA